MCPDNVTETAVPCVHLGFLSAYTDKLLFLIKGQGRDLHKTLTTLS